MKRNKAVKDYIKSISKEIRSVLPQAKKISVKVTGPEGQAVGKIELRCLQRSFYAQSISENIYDALELAKDSVIAQAKRMRRVPQHTMARRRVAHH
jgi:hypothetical protein